MAGEGFPLLPSWHQSLSAPLRWRRVEGYGAEVRRVGSPLIQYSKWFCLFKDRSVAVGGGGAMCVCGGGGQTRQTGSLSDAAMECEE